VQRSSFFEELLTRAQATPGTVSAALSSAPPPLGASRGALAIDVEGRSGSGVRHPPVRIREITPGYFETFRMPLTSGRRFIEGDRNAEPAVILSESAERILFAGQRAVGHRVRLATNGPWHTVVGVTPDLRNGQSLTDEPAPEAYVIARRDAWRALGHLALRTTASSEDATAFLNQIVASLDPTTPVTIETVEQQVERLTAQQRLVAWLLTAFAALAHIGVRIAIGAAPGDVGRQVVVEAGRWMLAGGVLGAALGWVSTRALQSQLYGVQALDPWAWAAAFAALAIVLVIAVVRPAYQAAHVDPIAALRAE
jgi:hypothetical protein